MLNISPQYQPADNRVVFKFELSDAVPSVNVSLYTRTGMHIGSYSFGEMMPGVNSLTITPDLDEGYYVAYFSARSHKFQAIIVK